MWTDWYKRNRSWHSLPWKKLIPSGTKTELKCLLVKFTGWQSGPSLTATRPEVSGTHNLKSTLLSAGPHSAEPAAAKKSQLRDISSPKSPSLNLLYRNKSCSFLMSKAFYTDKVFSSQLLCVLVMEPWEFPPCPLPAKHNFWAISAEYLHLNFSRARVTQPSLGLSIFQPWCGNKSSNCLLTLVTFSLQKKLLTLLCRAGLFSLSTSQHPFTTSI